MARLREALGDAACRLQTRGGGYALEVHDGELDVQRFERALEEAAAALSDGRPERALASASLALSLWRGAPLAGLEEHEWATREARRIDELRLSALQTRCEARLALGHHRAAIAELEPLVAADPDRERLCAALMLALYRDGRQPEALATFQKTRRLLVEEYGIEPGEELRGLHRAILAQDPALMALQRPPSAPAVQAGESSEAPPLPSRLRAYGPAELVGREREREALAEVLSLASRGERAAMLISGEPGVGKTRLVSEFAQQAHEEGWLVLGGRSDEALELPYQPFVEALEHLVEHAPEPLLRAHADDHGLAIARLVPLLARRLAGRSTVTKPASEAERYLLFVAIDGLVAAAAAGAAGGVLLVLEDLHWADAPTIVLLRYLLATPHRAHVAIVGTFRATELDDQHPLKQLLADLHREAHVARVDLAGLSPDEVGALASALAGHELDPGARRFAARLHATTNGNPFFIIELLRSLVETGTLSRASSRWEVTGPIDDLRLLPASITETLDRRIARLGREARDYLTAAAAIGDEFDTDLLASAAELDRTKLAVVLRRASSAGLVISGDEPRSPVRFAHALIGHWLYQQLGPVRQVWLHRQVGLELERRAKTEAIRPAVLARHWQIGAGASEIDKPLWYAVLAGDDAIERLAPDEARQWYDTALALHARRADPTDAERAELLIKRGEAEQRAGIPAFRETLLQAARLARSIGDSERLVRAALANKRGAHSSSGIVDDERLQMLEEAIAAVGPRPSLERALLLATQAAELTFSGQWARRLALSDEALALVRRLEDPSTLAIVLNLRFTTIWAPETHRERLANTAESISACERAGDPVALCQGYIWRFVASIEAAHSVEARRCANAARQLVNRVPQPTTLWATTCHEADVAMIDGRLDEAERLALEALRIGRTSQPDAAACFGAQLGAIRAEQGRLGELAGLLEQVIEANPGIPGFRAVLARALCELERVDEARLAMAPSLKAGFEDIPNDMVWRAVMCGWAETAARVADQSAARLLISKLEPWQAMIPYPGFGVRASVSHWLAELALTLDELELAARYHTEAARIHKQLGAPIWIAHSDYQAGCLLRRRGAHAAAAEAFTRALSAAERLGMNGLARWAGEALDTTAGRPCRTGTSSALDSP